MTHPLMAATILATAIAQIPVEVESDERQFQLNIGHREITRTNFLASTAFTLRNADGRLEVHAGAAVEAHEIRVTLHEVHGNVTFRASLSRLREVLSRYQTQRERR